MTLIVFMVYYKDPYTMRLIIHRPSFSTTVPHVYFCFFKTKGLTHWSGPDIILNEVRILNNCNTEVSLSPRMTKMN